MSLGSALCTRWEADPRTAPPVVRVKTSSHTQSEHCLFCSPGYLIEGWAKMLLSATFEHPTLSLSPVAGPAPHAPSIYGPGRSLAPAPLVQPPPPPLAPPPPGSSTNIRCCGCSKVLLKGQTAFQKKGSTQLFCSTVCLTGYLPPTVPARPCHQCLK